MFTKRFSQKAGELLTLGVITLMYIAVCAEADLYVPAFPKMVDYFGTAENKIQLLMSLNLAGICIASLICGPLSDAYGRRKVLISGLLLFAISSLGCVMATSFSTMLTFRVIQGLSASVPMVVGAAVFLDKYSLAKASQLIGIINTFITGAMAGAPILGAFITAYFHWRINFVVIAALVLLSLIGTWLFIDESLPEENKKPFNATKTLKDYFTVSSNLKFLCFSLIALMPFIAIMVYISNLSLIFINHLGVSMEAFGYYQGSTMGAFLFFSAVGARLIKTKGVEFTKNLGTIATIVGGVAFFMSALINPSSIFLICSSMFVFAAGGALITGIFGMKALELFPDIKGTASGAMTAIRQFLASGLVLVSEIFFNGTIVPVALIIFAYISIAFIWYALVREKKPVYVDEAAEQTS